MAQNAYIQISGSLPPGGATGQVLTKRSDSDGDVDWEPGGGGGTGITQLSGDVGAGPGFGAQVATVNAVGGSTAADVHTGEVAANAATSANTANTIVKRDASGNFSAGTITAALTGIASGNITSIPENRTGYVDLVNGNDSTGSIGDLTKPFQTLSAAEAAITTATSTNMFNLILNPGNYDVIGMVKKSNINWTGQGNSWLRDNIVKIFTNDASSLDLADPSLAINDGTVLFQDLTFECPISCDLFTLDPTGTNHSGFTFFNCTTFSPFIFIGRGADHDSIVASAMNFDDGFDITSVNLRGAGVYCAGGTNFRANNGRGAQFLTTGSLILSALLIQDVDNTSFCLFAGVGSIVGGPITVDGAMAQAYLDASISIAGSITQTNGGTLNLVTRAEFVNCTNPFKDNAGINSIDVNGRALKNTVGSTVLDWSDASQKAKFSGSIQVIAAGKGLDVAEGSNAKMGTAVLAGGTVTVSNTSVTTSSRIFACINAASGTVGAIYITNIVANTSFDIKSLNVLDTSTVAWMMVEAL